MSDTKPTSPPPPGWSDRVRFSAAGEGFAYRPGELITNGGDAAVELVSGLGLRPTDREDRGSFTVLRTDREADVLPVLAELRDAGFTAQPNHVFFADCATGCGCSCPPHPATPCGPGASPVYASPVYASPVYASPVYASPVYASPVYASPVYASPVYASPVYASPVYASPVYASHSWTAAQRATGIRQSSALAVPATAAEGIERQLKAAAEATTAAIEAKRATGPRVVVLDTGLAAAPFDHPVMGPCVTCPSGADDVPDRHPDPAGDDRLDPAAGHGTFIAGLVLQVEPRARVSVHRVLSGLGDGDEAAIAQAIEALAGQVDVLNLSFSGYTLEHPALLAAAVRKVQAAGALVVASAGNDATCRPTFPASLPEVISVGAVGPGGPAPFSNYGPWVRACAPGVDLISAFFRGFDGSTEVPNGDDDPDRFTGYARWSGTSFSAPLVAGALAREIGDGRSPEQAVERLIDSPNLYRIPNLGTVVNVG